MTEATPSTPRVFSPSALFTSLSRDACSLRADLLVFFAAVMLPWSTTAVAVLLGLRLFSLVPLLPTFDRQAFLRLLASPICLLPLAMVGLAMVGTLWADVPWRERFQGISPVAKLLALPILLLYFERSQRGAWVFSAFWSSCRFLTGAVVDRAVYPGTGVVGGRSPGVPVKNYIDQSQEFALCTGGAGAVRVHPLQAAPLRGGGGLRGSRARLPRQYDVRGVGARGADLCPDIADPCSPSCTWLSRHGRSSKIW